VDSQHRWAVAYAPAKLSELKTVHRGFQAWCRDEILRGLLTDVANDLRDRGVLDEEECFIDATFVMAKGGGAEIGPTKRGNEYDWYRVGRLLQCARGRSAVCKEHVRCKRDQFRSLNVKALAVSDHVTIIDIEVSPDDPTKIPGARTMTVLRLSASGSCSAKPTSQPIRRIRSDCHHEFGTGPSGRMSESGHSRHFERAP
jgi:hypothetical protein